MKKAKKQKSAEKYIINLTARYTIALLISLKMIVFYIVFMPLTFYPVLLILKLFYNAVGNISSALIYVNGFSIEIVGACVAVSAYLLLAVLNLTTPDIKWLKRIKIFLFCSASFLALNIIRIVILAAMLVQNSKFFDITHFIFWHALSIVFVVIIWLFCTRIFKIKAIPVLSDISYLKNLAKGKKK